MTEPSPEIDARNDGLTPVAGVPESISQRYRRFSADLADTITKVNLHRWNDQSPCEGWSALDVLRHLVDTQGQVMGFVGQEMRPGPHEGSDPLGAWISASGQVQGLLDDPQAAAVTFEGPDGPMGFEDAVDSLLSFDLPIHRWDLGVSVDLEVELAPADLAWLEDGARSMGEDIRVPGAFGPEIEAPGGSSEQVRLLAYLGRRAW